MGCVVVPKEVPFARLYKWIEEGQLDVATSVLKTREREKFAYYSQPTVAEYTIVMVRRGAAFRFETIRNLSGRQIGVQSGFRYPQLEDGNFGLLRERSHETNLRKVVQGRVDGILIGSITGPFLARQLGITELLEILPKAIGEVPLGVALNRRSFTAAQLASFDPELARQREARSWQNLLERNGVAGLIRAWPVIPRP